MSCSFGDNIKLTVFGQSHSESIGCVLDGVPAGERVDIDSLLSFMARRAPGQNAFSTPRKEADIPDIVSGITEGMTCGAPICAVIKNTNTRSGDYDRLKNTPRPGHADFTAFIKHSGHNDARGGGNFSGRMTAPLCFAGGVLMQILKRRGIEVAAHIYSIKDEFDDTADPVTGDMEKLKAAQKKPFPVINDAAGERMKEKILSAKKEGDSVGGIIECVITGVPAGVGEPIFDGIENRISACVFGVPAVKGIEFGSGFAAASLFGSENNDAFCFDKDKNIKTKTNNHGGILGGISSGMPIVFRVAMKPTPSIAKEQITADLASGEEKPLVIGGRHDPCIVQRAVPVIESAAALAMADLLLNR